MYEPDGKVQKCDVVQWILFTSDLMDMAQVDQMFNKLINTTEIAYGLHLNWFLIDSLKGFLPYHKVISQNSVWTTYYF